MFTGIIEEIGYIKEIKKGVHSSSITIFACKVMENLQVGDSVAMNGVCLTVTKIDARSYHVDVMPETYSRSNLHELSLGSAVNLERALQMNGRFGGHVVTGHVDDVGKITAIRKDENATWYTITTKSSWLRYVVEKGSIAVDGMSLTVAEVSEHGFSVSIIPHTASHTTLGKKKTGDFVNLEFDLLSKYTEKLLQTKQTNTLTKGFLHEYGFA